jgi:hypothetical protein
MPFSCRRIRGLTCPFDAVRGFHPRLLADAVFTAGTTLSGVGLSSMVVRWRLRGGEGGRPVRLPAAVEDIGWMAILLLFELDARHGYWRGGTSPALPSHPPAVSI